WLTSALFNLVVDTRPETLKGVRQVMTGGEAVSGAHVRRAQELNPGLRVVNGYGPSECTVFTSCHVVAEGFAEGEMPIGRPVGDRRVYVLDGRAEPVPVRMAGELYVGGAGVARGYLGRPELTAERFVPDPFSGEAGGRLYRSGDRVRWLASGELEYLGRMDQQVKVRGFRIEPGEVEAVLAGLPQVREAAVVVREDAPGEKRLVAYVVPQEGAGISSTGLQAHLSARLPSYMVPGAFVLLDRLPLNPNGKVDRRVLPAPARGAEEAYVAPRTATEEVLSGIWSEVLGVERVGVNEGFFELGGHSLLATRVLSLVREKLGVEVPLRAIFEVPTVAALAERVEAARDSEPFALARIPRREGNGPAPLSFAQQRLWFIHQLDPESSAYNAPFALRLQGALDVVALRRSLTEVVRRHEALRTVMVDRGGEVMQVVLPAAPVSVPVLDLSRLLPGSRPEEARRQITRERQAPFDLRRGPMMRVRLLKLEAEEWVLCFTMHHVVTDGWSNGVLVREVSTLYAAYSRGEESPLAELELQYADFAVWQREWLAGERLDAQLRYWRERLDGAPPLLELPTDRPRRSAIGAMEAGTPCELSPATTRALHELGQGESATLFMTLLAAWQVLLARYSGQDDVVVGTPIANRTRVETEGLIGFFVNSLALRADLSDDPTFRVLLGRVREAALGAFAHQDLPFERLVDELAPERSLTHNPIFQVMFALQNMEVGALALGDVRAELLGSGETGALFDVRATLSEVDERIQGRILYRTDLFDAETIERMVEHFQALLEAVAADPERRVAEIDLLRPAERERILVEWNATGRPSFAGPCLHRLIAAQAKRTPNAVAVVAGPEALTFAELERRSNRLARWLRGRGVGPEVPVGICMERSGEMVVALLATLKAGGAYIPLDPGYPAERLGYMLEDARVRLLLTRADLLERLPPHAAEPVCLDGLWVEAMDEDDTDPEVDVSPDGLAYVIFTSGSTGRPKGAMNAHAGIVNRLLWMQEEYGLGPDDVVLQKTPFSFDVSVWEFFWPLMTGARLVLARPEGHRDPAYLSELIEREGVTTLHFVPPMLQAFLEAGEPWRCRSVRRVMCSGEALPYELMERFFSALPGAELHNLYGPTEAAVDVTYWACGPRARRVVPIGRPVANTRLYVLGSALLPVPVGVVGELFIGGVQVGRGYLGRPELTAETFVPDPLSPTPGARLYRTGDRARWLASGELEFLGRVDTQVKIRGFRIEPGELEAVLTRHPAVREAVVVVREAASGTPGDKRLVAYVVPGREPGEDVEEAEFQAEHVQEWESIFGDTYSGKAADPDPAFNIVGWNSSYTGKPIPAEEMREWVEDAVARLRALRPRRVLELGCGTGLLLFRLAPECEEYWGTDLSPAALSYLRAQLERPGRELPGVRLLERTADDFAGIPEGHFDLVVVNSVVQYFPGVEYLLQVLEGAVAALAPGGTLWVGDVRSLPLQESFHVSVELVQAGGDVPGSALRDRVRRRVMRDKELLLDPELFRALPHRLPRISGVEIRLKHGGHFNEMTRFRYDVLLHVESEALPAAPVWRRWDELGGLDAVGRVLDGEAPEALAVSQVPNPRVAGALAVLEALACEAESQSVEELCALAAEREGRTPDPEAFRELAEARGYRAHSRWSARGGPGEYDVLLVRNAAAALLEEATTPLPWSAYASDPLASRRVDWLLP
ncbi:MAG TPA: amino acid adenylation domain-containing protein, partial [Longimicrobiaceae bacterium]